jgi:hypothetical protein
MRTVWKRFLPLGVILVIGLVQVCVAPHERASATATCSPKPLDLSLPVTAWLGS